MRILIAEDDPDACRVLEKVLLNWGYEVVATHSGQQALDSVQSSDGAQLCILDWMMPQPDGLEVCRRLRQPSANSRPLYIILLTGKQGVGSIVEGLNAGADDFVLKPFQKDELKARIGVGERVLKLQSELANRVKELEAALSNVKQLQKLLPICSYCKKIRDDRNYWHQVDAYVSQHSGATFSHGICPACYETIVKPELAQISQGNQGIT